MTDEANSQTGMSDGIVRVVVGLVRIAFSRLPN